MKINTLVFALVFVFVPTLIAHADASPFFDRTQLYGEEDPCLASGCYVSQYIDFGAYADDYIFIKREISKFRTDKYRVMEDGELVSGIGIELYALPKLFFEQQGGIAGIFKIEKIPAVIGNEDDPWWETIVPADPLEFRKQVLKLTVPKSDRFLFTFDRSDWDSWVPLKFSYDYPINIFAPPLPEVLAGNVQNVAAYYTPVERVCTIDACALHLENYKRVFTFTDGTTKVVAPVKNAKQEYINGYRLYYNFGDGEVPSVWDYYEQLRRNVSDQGKQDLEQSRRAEVLAFTAEQTRERTISAYMQTARNNFYIALGVTLGLELAIVLFAYYLQLLTPKPRLIDLLVVGVVGTLLTLPYLWFIAPRVLLQSAVPLVMIEVVIALVEAGLYRRVTGISVESALLLSFVANASSFFLGSYLVSLIV